jgi:hypothetical protein
MRMFLKILEDAGCEVLSRHYADDRSRGALWGSARVGRDLLADAVVYVALSRLSGAST